MPMSPRGERILARLGPAAALTLLSRAVCSSAPRISAGTYTCLATNSRGRAEASADLVVWGEVPGRAGGRSRLCVSVHWRV